MRLTRLLVVGSALVCALLAAGCGGPLTTAEYAAKVEAIDKDLGAASDQLAKTSPSSSKAIVDAADSFRGAVTQAKEDLQELEPPEALKDEHATLLKSLQDSEKAAQAMSTSAAKKDIKALTRASKQLTAAGTRGRTAMDAISAAKG